MSFTCGSPTFGATTYTSVAKALQQAAQDRRELTRILKGHLANDKRSFSATLALSPDGQDQIIIQGDTQLSPTKALNTLNNSVGFRQVISLKDAAGRVRSNLVSLLRSAFQKAKSGSLPALEEFDSYLKDKTNRMVQQHLSRPLEQGLGGLEKITSLKDLEKLTTQVNDKQNTLITELEALEATESARLNKLFTAGKITAEQLKSFNQALSQWADSHTRGLMKSFKDFNTGIGGDGPLSNKLANCLDQFKSLQDKLRRFADK